MQTASVVIKDSPGVSVSKKKAQAKVDRVKGIDLISNVALLEAAQLKKSENESWGESRDDNDSNDDDNNDDNDGDEKQDDEYVHTPNHYVPTKDKMNDESDEVTEEEYKRINEEIYGDVNISLTDVELADKEKDNEEMIVAGHVNVNKEGVGNQFKDDAQATQKIEAMTTEAITSTNDVSESESLDAFHQRITNLEKDVK
nr:hypothetical protein [Tanacetum cinerariifolium]